MRQNILPPVIVTHFVSYWSSPLLEPSPSCWLSHEELSSNTRGHVDACCPLFNCNLIQAIMILTRFNLMTLTLTLNPRDHLRVCGLPPNHSGDDRGQLQAWCLTVNLIHTPVVFCITVVSHDLIPEAMFTLVFSHWSLTSSSSHLHLVALHWSCTIFVIHQLASWLCTEADPYSGRYHHTQCHVLNVNHPCACVSHWATSSFQQESDQRNSFLTATTTVFQHSIPSFSFFILSIVYVLFKLVFFEF